MILQALYHYYLRRQADANPDRRLPAFGLEQKEISFILEVDESGRLHAIIDSRQMIGKKKLGTSYLVPKGVKKTSGIAANLLWDNAEYVLAIPDVKKLDLARSKGGVDEYLARLVEMRQAFRDRISTLPALALTDAGLRGVLAFLDSSPAEQMGRFAAHAEIAASNPVLTFRLVNDTALVCQRPGVVPHLVVGVPEAETSEEGDGLNAMCLITGDTLPVERLHTAIKGVWGAQTSGANIVSFNLDAFNSYGKSQGANAPVSHAAAFAYTTALNALLARDSSQRVQVGDASTVFWSQKSDTLEHELAALLGGGDNPDAHTLQVKAVLEAIHSGGFSGARGENAFYVLGLAPNAARISVRFWHAAPVHVIAERIAAWFDDLSLVRGPNDPEFPSLFRLLTAVALQGKADNIPPSLGGDLIRSIFTGAPYPTTWLNAAVQRCRAEQQVTYMRAVAIKAFLNRSVTTSDSQPREIQPMLDIESPSTAYRLGRLFATLEKIQEESSGGQLNSTIRERYYGAASSTPVAVFTTLMRLKNHHLAKMQSKGRAVNFEKLLAEILSGVSDFPVHMNLPDQGRFAIGYYHQRQDFFTKRESAEAESAALTETAH
jgi:CRISPR-associated protein Csd1